MQEMVNREDQETKERHNDMDDVSPVPVPSTSAAETFAQSHVVTPSEYEKEEKGQDR